MEGPQSVGHTCNVCLDTLGANGGVSTLLCGHPFCRECLSRWQATSSLCPVCRADQRTLERNASQGPGQSSGVFGTDETDHVEGPSLATILGLMGQLLAREGAGPLEVYPHFAPHEGRDIHYSWSPQHQEQNAPQPEAIEELQSSVQFVMARINSLERQPLYWSSLMAELQEALEELAACRRGAVPNPAQVIQQVQLYTDTVNAQLDEFLTQTEAREQQQRAAEHRQQPSQPSSPPFASAPPQPGTRAHSSNAPTSASGSATSEASQGSRAWKWGWGPAPPGTTNEESSAPGTSSSEPQQASGIGFGAAAAAAAALAAVGTAAKAAYRRATAESSPDANATDARTEAAGSSAHRPPPAGSSRASNQQPPGAAGSGATAGQAAPVQGVYNAVRGIFDQHVSADSSLGGWSEVARHLTDLHGQMNADEPQHQDVGRLLASAVNAYSAYRRATASSSSTQ
ncbi:hypothetical protein ABBQ32_000276 [Trebouxia sp. C0010 RCD-2024]